MLKARKEDRRELVRPVYFLDETDSAKYAFSTNLSPCGICIITNRNSLAPGDTVNLYSRFFWDSPKKAIAVWTREVNDTVIRVGLDLCEKDTVH